MNDINENQINQLVDIRLSSISKYYNDSTLLNAGKTTNFIFKVHNLEINEELIDSVNTIDTKSKIKDRITAINNLGGSMMFYDMENGIFKNNLVLIDSLLPNILGEIVHLFYTSSYNSIHDLTEQIHLHNPLGFDNQFSHEFYKYKIKRFLTDIAVGMMPSKVWSGKYDATGGYLIVKENGDVLCYHVYNRNQFEDYLYANTKLETASSTRHDFGKLYIENGVLYFKLNLQIRFK
jgi:hypothetical protein